jgi:hypothetical protein
MSRHFLWGPLGAVASAALFLPMALGFLPEWLLALGSWVTASPSPRSGDGERRSPTPAGALGSSAIDVASADRQRQSVTCRVLFSTWTLLLVVATADLAMWI